jgi:hypothetical protein
MPSGAPLGIGGITYTTSEYALAPGSILVLYTDGLIEARGCDLDQRLARLTHLLSGSRHSLNGLCDLLLADLAPHPAQDDIAVLAVRIGTPTAERSRPAGVGQVRTRGGAHAPRATSRARVPGGSAVSG